jgi:ProP effector
VQGRERRPLKIGINEELVAALAIVEPREIGFALGSNTGHAWYLAACVAGAARIALDGSEAGTVTPEEAAHAASRLHDQIAKQKAAKAARSAPAPKRIGLGDLRAAASARPSLYYSPLAPNTARRFPPPWSVGL